MGYSLAAVNQWNLIALALYFYMLFLFILNNGILYAYYVDLCRSMQNICNWFINRRIFNRICLYCWWTTVKLYHYIYNRNSSHDEILPRNGFPPNGSRRDFLLQSESSETACFFAPRNSAAPNIARYWNSERPRQPKKALLRPQAWRSAVGHVRNVGELKLLHLHWCHQTWEWKINEFKWKSQV